MRGGHTVQAEVDTAAALTDLNKHLESPLSREEALASSQKALSTAIDLHSLHSQTQTLPDQSIRDRARLHSVGLPGAGDWLNAIPSKALGLHLRPKEFTVSVQYHLGLKVFPEEGPCPACKAHSDSLGDHALGCAGDGERIARHNHLRDSLYQTARQAGLGPTREEGGILQDSGERPGDIYIPSWTKGLDTALDVTVVSPLQAALVRKAAQEPGRSNGRGRWNSSLT